jgi:quercetin dioxygenase-like cupin family protein
MKLALLICATSLLVIAVAASVLAESPGHQTIVRPQEIKWGPAPPALPRGAQSAVLFGNPSQAGPLVVRLKLAKGYRLPAMVHPEPKFVFVISGVLHLGIGATADRSKAQALPAGSFAAIPAGTAHYAFANEVTVVQLNSTGPWDITYVNPKDDPRQGR